MRARLLTRPCFFIFLAAFLAGHFPSFVAAEDARPATPASPPAGTATHRFSLEASTSLVSGEAREYVFSDMLILSDLRWPSSPAFSAGLAGSYEHRRGFVARARLNAGLPGKTGLMNDRDWMNIDATPGDYSDDWLTHYSQHDCVLMESIDLEGSLGWSLATRVSGEGKEGPRFTFLAGFRYQWLHWEARDGYIQYASFVDGSYEEWTDSLPEYSMSGAGIIYRQEWFMPFARVAAAFVLPARLTLDLETSIYPWLACTGVDDHLHKDFRFFDTTKGGSAFELAVGLRHTLNERMAISLMARYLQTDTLRGDTDVYDLSTLSWLTRYLLADGGGGGAALRAFALSAGLRVTFP